MSASPTKDDTPGADAKASDKPTFTEKEERVLKIAWLCLKTGPPDVDLAKLQELGGFNTAKTTSNTWGGIKKRLLAMAPKTEGDGGDGAGGTTPKTPKAKATPKKRGKKASDDDGGDADGGAEDGSPQKKPRKTPVKKGKKAMESGGDGEAVDGSSDVKMEGDEE